MKKYLPLFLLTMFLLPAAFANDNESPLLETISLPIPQYFESYQCIKTEKGIAQIWHNQSDPYMIALVSMKEFSTMDDLNYFAPFETKTCPDDVEIVSTELLDVFEEGEIGGMILENRMCDSNLFYISVIKTPLATHFILFYTSAEQLWMDPVDFLKTVEIIPYNEQDYVERVLADAVDVNG